MKTTIDEHGMRERLVRFHDPAATAAAIKALSGLDAMRAAASGALPKPAIAELMLLEIAEVEVGSVTFVGTPDESHYNPLGIVHGGFALTLFDSALGCAIHTHLEAGVGYVTTDIQVRFIRAISVSTGPVRCHARTVHVGRSTAIAEATLVDGAGKLLGTATTSCMIMRP